MIPQRLRVSGFLSYREEQRFDFSSAKLWRLSGANGSGKSGFFDAITWALFGVHRGGALAADLIHQQSELASVELEFQQDRYNYRIVRRLRRVKDGHAGEVQAFEFANDNWQAIPGTDRRHGFDDWVARDLKLDATAFLAGTLIRERNNLIDAGPKERAAVVSHRIGLDRVRQLAAHAGLQRAKCDEMLGASPEALPADQSEDELATAEAVFLHARNQVTRNEELLLQSQRKADRLTAFESAKAKRDEAEELLREQSRIDADYARYLELQAHLPAAEQILQARGRLEESALRRARVEAHRGIARQQKQTHDDAAANATARKETLRSRLDDVEAKLEKLSAQHREAALLAQSHRQHEQAAAEVERIDGLLKEFRPDFHGRLTSARSSSAELERLTQLRQQQFLLRELKQAEMENTETVRIARSARDDLRQEGLLERQRFDALQQTTQATAQETGRLQAEQDRARLVLRQAEGSVQMLESLGEAVLCRFCGQTLTPEHRLAEAERRHLELSAATTAVSELQSRLEATQRKFDEQRRERHDSESRIQTLRDRWRDAQQHVVKLENDSREIRRELQAIPHSLLALESLDRQMAELQPSATELETLERRAPAWQALQMQLMTAQTALARLTPSPEAVWELETGKAREAEQQRLLKSLRKELDETEREIEKHSRQAHAALTDLTEATGHLKLEEASRTQNEQMIQELIAKLPGGWPAALTPVEFAKWTQELEALRQGRIPVRHRQLEVARLHCDQLRRESDESQDAWNQAPGIDAATAMQELELARAAFAQAEALLINARVASSRLQEKVANRQSLDERLKAAAAERLQWRRLEELLGPHGLQKLLLQRAENRIVHQANGHLTRLGHPDLHLQLAAPGEIDAALHLQAIDTRIGPEPLGLAFLSAGQRFVVHLALALSLTAEPECLLIDDGLESLDQANRGIAIHAMRSLSETMACLIVVTPDASIAAGYQFDLTDGATAVRAL